MNTYTGFGFILFAALLWGLIGVISRFLFEAGLQPSELAFWRAFFGGLLFMGVALVRKEARVRTGKDLAAFMLFGVFSFGAFFVSFMSSIQANGAALAAVLLYTAPAWVAVSARVFFKEPVTPVKYAAIVIAVSGVALVSLSGASGDSRISAAGVAIGLAAGFFYSTQYVATKKLINEYSSFTIFGYSLLFAALALFPFTLFTEKTPADWLILFSLGACCTFLPYVCYAAGIRRIEVSTASVVATFEPVIATAAAWLVWNETFSGLGWLGAAMVIGAVFMLVMASSSR